MSQPTPSPYQCHTCGSSSSSVTSRNLVVFIDGTSNKPGPKKTNVKKLHDILTTTESVSGFEQHKRYLEGIGAHEVNHLPLPSRVGKAIYSGFEMAFAWNVEKNVQDAYRWLAETYQEGDRIYLFGFSRGAYQVRALAGVIHEVGLLPKSEVKEDRVEQAYHRYISIDPNNPKTKEAATQFKKDFCRKGVRVHFVGVWDTVSSLGLIKTAVHITASASVTNACHFRHALALDERRVKFMPEYFSEVNAHRSNIRSPRTAIRNNIKEVWFAGSHSDVGGMNRPHAKGDPNPPDDERHPVHSGNVPFVWMRREAAGRGLVFEPEAVTWGPEDIDFGRKDTMTWLWRILEVIRIYHQVSFSGTGKHDWRKHGFRPRPVIPNQQIHLSVSPGDMYAPRGTLAHRIDIPTVPQQPSGELLPTELWTTELLDEGTITSVLESLLNNQSKTLKSLGEVLLLLEFRLDNRQTRTICKPEWLERSMSEQSGFDKFALILIHDVVSNFSTSELLVENARDALKTVLANSDHSGFQRALYVIRFSARHQNLRERFIAHDGVIQALVVALENVPKGRSKNSFPLVTESLCHLVDSGERRDCVIHQLTAVSEGAEEGKTRLSLALEVKTASHLVASLTMIAALAKHLPVDQSSPCESLKPKIIDLAKQGRSPVGAAAVEALVALKEPLPHDVHISSILAYLGNTLPRLDAEIGNTTSPNDAGDLPFVLRGSGSGGLNDELVQKIVSTISSWNAHLRTAATLTLLKLCNYPTVRDYCLREKVLDNFVKQLERKKTSLLAAYSLMTCLKHNMWTSENLPRAPQLIIDMLDKGWFDDAVGRLEGSKIFGDFMASDGLRQEVLRLDIVGTLKKQLESGDHHKTRMGLICLEVFWGSDSAGLTQIVDETLKQLRDPNQKAQKKGARMLSALARTKVGEEAIIPRVIEIVKMLLPPPEGSLQSRSRLFGPTAAVYDLCRNETLRKFILDLKEYQTFRRLRNESDIYPPSGTTR